MKETLKPLFTKMALAARAILTIAQGTTSTGQGRLNDGGNSASTICDFVFHLYHNPTGGTSRNTMAPPAAFSTASSF